MQSGRYRKSTNDYWKNSTDFTINPSIKLGGGITSTIYAGVISKSKKSVAIKKYNTNEYIDYDVMIKEIQIMQALTDSKAPHCVKLYGYFTDNQNDYHIAMTYAQEGTLYDWLKRDVYHPRLRPHQQMQIMCGIAKALTHMHNADIIHGDIRPENILLDSSLNPMLCDFSKAIRIDDDNAIFLSGSIKYLAPELLVHYYDNLTHQRYSIKTDIYSFSLVCWQIVAEKNVLYPHIEKTEEVLNWVNYLEARENIPDEAKCPAKVAEFITLGWAQNPKKRPSAKKALQFLSAATIPTGSRCSQSDLENAIDFLDKNYGFFAAPFEECEEFQTWAQNNEREIKDFSDAMKTFLNSKDQLEGFKKALIGSSETDANCLRSGRDALIRDFLLHNSNKDFISFLLQNMNNPIINKWYDRPEPPLRPKI